jgi:prolyl 3-hydroxylase /prolyl 3,4-dihydroxylase
MRPRSPEDTGNAPAAKRQRRSGSLGTDSHDPVPFFAANLLSASSVSSLANQYRSAQPFKHVVIDKIFQESLLMKVKDEIIEHLSFTEKETDIYKASPSVNSSKSFLLTMRSGSADGRPRVS